MRSLLILLVLSGAALAQPGPGPDGKVDAATRAKVIEGTLAALTKAYVFPDVAAKMSETIKKHVVLDPGLIRPAEVDQLIGDASKAHAELGWRPEVGFRRLVTMMVDADMKRYAI